MATWTRTEDADFILYERSDGEAGYRIRKTHPHFHAEQWMPWGEVAAHLGGVHAETDAWFRESLETDGHTVVG